MSYHLLSRCILTSWGGEGGGSHNIAKMCKILCDTLLTGPTMPRLAPMLERKSVSQQSQHHCLHLGCRPSKGVWDLERSPPIMGSTAPLANGLGPAVPGRAI